MRVHSLVAERAGRAFAPHRHRRPVAKRLMWALAIVEGNPASNSGVHLVAVRVAF